MQDVYAHLIANIETLMVRKRLSQRELADKMGADEGWVSKVLKGKKPNLPLTTLGRFATALGVTPSYLLGDLKAENDAIIQFLRDAAAERGLALQPLDPSDKS